VVIEDGRLVGVLSERRALEKSEISIVEKIGRDRKFSP